MRIVCCIKHVIPADARLRVEGLRVVGLGARPVMNPFDEFAVEEALRISERHGAEVVLANVGGPEAEEAIRHGFALGADRALRLDPAGLENVDAAVVAALLAAALRDMEFDLILCGKTSIDANAAEVPGRLAELLDLALVTAATRLEIGEGNFRVERCVNGCSCVVELSAPALVAADRGLNTPRYPKLPDILKARKKQIVVKTPGELGYREGGDLPAPAVRRVEVSMPPPRKSAEILSGSPQDASRALIVRLVGEKLLP